MRRPAAGILLLLVCLVCYGCQAAGVSTPVSQYAAVARPYRFDFLRWEWVAFTGPNSPFRYQAPANVYDTASVYRYLAIEQQLKTLEEAQLAQTAEGLEPDRERSAYIYALRSEREQLEPLVERIIAAQVTAVYQEAGIHTPLDRFIRLPFTIPVVWFKLDRLPHLLVVSPRERIESVYEAMLLQDLDAEIIESIEHEIGALGASGLIVPLGGFGATYPSFVTSEGDLRFIIETVCEEWLHQYLAFTPLGFRYVLDLTHLKPDYPIATMNETLAGLVSDEIAGTVLARYYSQPVGQALARYHSETFDFNREMRQIRLRVDELLAAGQVERAEAFMRERRDFLEQQGYYIRKLNQAYFAFYGTYADSPTSVDPIGTAMRTLRARYTSVAEFLNAAVSLTSQEQLFSLVDTVETEGRN